ncbi:DUF3168 domain-containing protein [Sphingorhabdus sp. 109]|jgi:hypothetical protein|uniref:DUF3168 domain-containing protein n=1 Tax=Sphingorhabdus sp. 109 TaxID=2653173 RepID=UPI0012EFA0C8|nr:DUF3168 domain-containing protein [Sphingorhabdus sp. 109]VWX61281.1 conserved hypothetical protein [Sphingorhabdus sp. 109]
MSSALEAVQRQLVARLNAHTELTGLVSGIFDGPPPQADFPYIALATGASLDWSHKGGVGRELSLALTVHDDGETAARLHRLMALVEEVLEPGLDDPDGWQIVTFDFRRTRILRSAVSPWSGLVEYRARVLRA